MPVADLRQRLADHGAGPAHAARVLRLWLHGLPPDHGRRPIATFLPASLRAALPALLAEWDGLATLRSAHPAADGGERLLLALRDGHSIESVLLPRDGLCVSTQVGCAVGCGFCMTGRDGLLRQLDATEIVAQLALARRRRAVRKLVFMGMGEPAHNLDAVLDAVELCGREGGLGHKQIVVSTVGDARLFERLMALPVGAVRPALALSLHSTDAARRGELLPRAPRIAPAELVAAACAYARAVGYPLQVQWTLLAGVNDGADEADALIALLRGQPAMVNLIPVNPVPGSPWQRPSAAAAEALAARLRAGRVLATLRWSAAQDVDGGCGQLRARHAPTAAAPPHAPRRAIAVLPA